MPVAAKANRAVFRDAEARRYRTAGELADHLQVAQTAASASAKKPAASGAEYLDGIADARRAAPLYLAQMQG
jgi:hypothetical protein